jgi:hypothetical protein
MTGASQRIVNAATHHPEREWIELALMLMPKLSNLSPNSSPLWF